jgi:UPF0716 family protein affecting phage T7 exclusion
VPTLVKWMTLALLAAMVVGIVYAIYRGIRTEILAARAQRAAARRNAAVSSLLGHGAEDLVDRVCGLMVLNAREFGAEATSHAVRDVSGAVAGVVVVIPGDEAAARQALSALSNRDLARHPTTVHRLEVN